MSNKEKGSKGELIAADYLVSKGYVIREKNYRYRRSEIDLIAEKHGFLVFVEVKTRTSVAFGYPEEAVNNVKVERVLEGADHYVHQINWEQNIRFDIIAIDYATGKITHFEDAFY